MDDNKEFTTKYEPNFILKDDAPQQTGTYSGSYNDPRSNFGQSPQAAPHPQPEQRRYYNNDFNGASETFNEGQPPHRVKKPKKEKKPAQVVTITRKSLALFVILMMFCSAVFGVGSTLAVHSLLGETPASASTGILGDNGAYTLEDSTSAAMSISQITQSTQKSVVEIRTESVASDSWMREYVTEGAGSGVIISNDGYIMTNNHVIDGARKITVTTIDEKTYSATLVGTDPKNDVAVIKIDAENLSAATYGNSDQLQVGDLAVAIGNPLGELGGTVTSGIISSLDRQLSIDGKTMRLLQTDASINPGNSGGGLFNDDGHLIGLVVAKSSGSDVEGLGFAIPINTAAEVASQLMDKGYVSGEAYSGMTYQEGYVNQQPGGYNEFDIEQFFGGGQTQQTAVYIVEVNGKNAKEAGFKAGDMVYAVDDKQISTFNDLTSILTTKTAGDKIKYTIVRDGELKNIKFELEEKPHEDSKKS